jgi:hypothetical protein
MAFSKSPYPQPAVEPCDYATGIQPHAAHVFCGGNWCSAQGCAHSSLPLSSRQAVDTRACPSAAGKTTPLRVPPSKAVAHDHSRTVQNAQILLCREVGLLKINVERAEWDVLAGIQPHHWPKVSELAAVAGCAVLCYGSLPQAQEEFCFHAVSSNDSFAMALTPTAGCLVCDSVLPTYACICAGCRRSGRSVRRCTTSAAA